jgi:uncharacterized protein GlcG (DUF336 family)
MRGLSLEEANTIIAATFAAAKKRKCRPMSAIVLDAAKLCADSDFFDDPNLMRALSIHKSAPLVDPRSETKSRTPGVRAGRNGSNRNGSTRRGTSQTAKSGP